MEIVSQLLALCVFLSQEKSSAKVARAEMNISAAVVTAYQRLQEQIKAFISQLLDDTSDCDDSDGNSVLPKGPGRGHCVGGRKVEYVRTLGRAAEVYEFVRGDHLPQTFESFTGHTTVEFDQLYALWRS